MTQRFKNITLTEDNALFNEKKLNLTYTICIIKPHICIDPSLTQEIISRIEEEGFEIRFVLQRTLTDQETQNLYYLHEGKEYFKELIVTNSTGHSLVMLLSHESGEPVIKLKELMGNKDPEIAKTKNPESLRAKYGESLIENAISSSDDTLGANKDRDIFKFPIPQKIPEFKFDKQLISKGMILKFLHPANIEHSDWNGRLDLLGLYGPVLNYHSVDTCLCVPCGELGNDWINKHKAELIESEKERLGMNTEKQKKI